MNVIRSLFATREYYSTLILRVLLGIVFFPHGAQKMLGWFGGNGFSATMNYFQHQGMPAALAFLVIIGEFLGSIGLILGFLTRISAFGIFCIMTGAIAMVHYKFGFFMNWQGNQQGEGFEYHLLAIAIAVALMFRGGGALSVDGAIANKMPQY